MEVIKVVRVVRVAMVIKIGKKLRLCNLY